MTGAGPFSSEEKQYILDHMNDDHRDACLLYVQHYCEIKDAEAAALVYIDGTSMTLSLTRQGAEEQTVFEFDSPLESVAHAAKVLAEMVYAVKGEPQGD